MEIKWGTDLQKISLKDLGTWLKEHRSLEKVDDPEVFHLWGTVFGYAKLLKLAEAQDMTVRPTVLERDANYEIVSK